MIVCPNQGLMPWTLWNSKRTESDENGVKTARASLVGGQRQWHDQVRQTEMRYGQTLGIKVVYIKTV